MDPFVCYAKMKCCEYGPPKLHCFRQIEQRKTAFYSIKNCNAINGTVRFKIVLIAEGTTEKVLQYKMPLL